MTTSTRTGTCTLCGGLGEIGFEDPVTRCPASMLCPSCTPEGVDLDPRVEDHVCQDPTCTHEAHLPDRDDTVWTNVDDDASWVEFDYRAKRREDR